MQYQGARRNPGMIPLRRGQIEHEHGARSTLQPELKPEL